MYATDEKNKKKGKQEEKVDRDPDLYWECSVLKSLFP
jgi:hypothetical protein